MPHGGRGLGSEPGCWGKALLLTEDAGLVGAQPEYLAEYLGWWESQKGGPSGRSVAFLGGTEGTSVPEKASDMSDWRQESDQRGHEHRVQMMAIPALRPAHQPGSHPKAGRDREQKQTPWRPANTGPTFILMLPRGEGIQARLASNQEATQVCPPPWCGQGVPNDQGRTSLKKQPQPAS